MFVGVGPARVRDLFAKARKKSPCIVFIDEIDAVGRARQRVNYGNDERENTLNQLLVELDGFNTQEDVLVFAATNRPDVLDKALTRPGRFDRRIHIDPPDLKGRNEILKVHMKVLALEKNDLSFYSEKIATLTPGFVGADLANVCNEAALIAAREGKKFVQLHHFEAAIDRVIGGIEKKSKIIPIEEKTIVAYHEAGHAIAGWFLEHSMPLLKVSIVPRGTAALGYAQYQPKDKYLYSKEQLLDTMCVMLGGRVSEFLTFNKISTGASDDLEKVTKLAYDQISRFGFSDKIKNVSFKPPNEYNFQERIYSQKTQTIIDEEVRELVHHAQARTEGLLRIHVEDIKKVAEKLLETEKIDKDDLVSLLGERPFKEERTYKELLQEMEEKEKSEDGIKKEDPKEKKKKRERE